VRDSCATPATQQLSPQACVLVGLLAHRGTCRRRAAARSRKRRVQFCFAGLGAGQLQMDIGYFLKLMTEKNASDMFLTTGAPVNIKVEGKLYPLGNTGLPAGMVKKIAYSLMDEGQVPMFERDLELNMAIAVKDAGRFRINVFKQRGEVGMVIRAIKRDPHDRAAQAAATSSRTSSWNRAGWCSSWVPPARASRPRWPR
jgi:twitching motility protein PilU